MRVGIIGAMQIEVEGLKSLMENPQISKSGGILYYSGKINGIKCVVAEAGVGKVNAAVCAQTMILKYTPDMIVNIGVAGGLDDKLKTGDVAVADFVVEHDMDTTPIGDPAGFITGLNKIMMECDSDITNKLYNSALKKSGINVIKGVIASGDQFIAGQEQRERIKKNFNAIAAEMEGAAIGHVCMMSDIPFGVIRVISDGANEESYVDFPVFAKQAAAKSIDIVLEFLDELEFRQTNIIKKIKSFMVDHTKITEGIYISRVDGDCVTYDLRFCKPNTDYVLDNNAIHSIEHMIATFMRNSDISEEIVYFGPMGCRTGFYLIVRDTVSPDKVLEVLKDALQKLMEYDGEVFGVSEKECGNYRSHDLKLAKEICVKYLEDLNNVKTILNYEQIH